MYEKIFDALNENDIIVYPPGTKTGICTYPYVVVKDAGASKHTSFSTQIQYYDLLIYIPVNQYSSLEKYVKKVKNIMNKLYPMVKTVYTDQPSYYDDTIKAHMKSIMYENYQKI